MEIRKSGSDAAFFVENYIYAEKMHFLFAHIKKILYLCTSFLKKQKKNIDITKG